MDSLILVPERSFLTIFNQRGITVTQRGHYNDTNKNLFCGGMLKLCTSVIFQSSGKQDLTTGCHFIHTECVLHDLSCSV